MKRILKKINSLESALRFFDAHGNITNVSNLTGDVSNLRGDVSYLLTGDVSYLRGNVSNLTGDVSNLRGNVDNCEITAEERAEGVRVEDLIA